MTCQPRRAPHRGLFRRPQGSAAPLRAASAACWRSSQRAGRRPLPAGSGGGARPSRTPAGRRIPRRAPHQRQVASTAYQVGFEDVVHPADDAKPLGSRTPRGHGLPLKNSQAVAGPQTSGGTISRLQAKVSRPSSRAPGTPAIMKPIQASRGLRRGGTDHPVDHPLYGAGDKVAIVPARLPIRRSRHGGRWTPGAARRGRRRRSGSG